jgi:hypothetical protein
MHCDAAERKNDLQILATNVSDFQNIPLSKICQIQAPFNCSLWNYIKPKYRHDESMLSESRELSSGEQL